jgi:hypothetical protein
MVKTRSKQEKYPKNNCVKVSLKMRVQTRWVQQNYAIAHCSAFA